MVLMQMENEKRDGHRDANCCHRMACSCKLNQVNRDLPRFAVFSFYSNLIHSLVTWDGMDELVQLEYKDGLEGLVQQAQQDCMDELVQLVYKDGLEGLALLAQLD